jgi:hypothetical protein
MYNTLTMIFYTRYPEQNFTLFISKGDTTIDEWLATVSRYGSDGMTRLELYDLRLHTNLYSNDEIERILQKTISDASLRPAGAKTAVLVNETSQFGLARMYELKSEVEGIESTIQINYSLIEGTEWLGGNIKELLKDYV